MTEYRRNVAVIVVDDTGRILACERSDVAGAWQLPQGGIEDGETPQEALFRELEEEIGTAEAEIVAQLPEVIRYDWPPHLHKRGYIGQEQTYFVVRLLPKAKINLNNDSDEVEFQAYEWLRIDEFLSRISGFKAEAYAHALSESKKLLPDIFA